MLQFHNHLHWLKGILSLECGQRVMYPFSTYLVFFAEVLSLHSSYWLIIRVSVYPAYLYLLLRTSFLATEKLLCRETSLFLKGNFKQYLLSWSCWALHCFQKLDVLFGHFHLCLSPFIELLVVQVGPHVFLCQKVKDIDRFQIGINAIWDL